MADKPRLGRLSCSTRSLRQKPAPKEPFNASEKHVGGQSWDVRLRNAHVDGVRIAVDVNGCQDDAPQEPVSAIRATVDVSLELSNVVVEHVDVVVEHVDVVVEHVDVVVEHVDVLVEYVDAHRRRVDGYMEPVDVPSRTRRRG
jgi:hypothetical protein